MDFGTAALHVFMKLLLAAGLHSDPGVVNAVAPNLGHLLRSAVAHYGRHGKGKKDQSTFFDELVHRKAEAVPARVAKSLGPLWCAALASVAAPPDEEGEGEEEEEAGVKDARDGDDGAGAYAALASRTVTTLFSTAYAELCGDGLRAVLKALLSKSGAVSHRGAKAIVTAESWAAAQDTAAFKDVKKHDASEGAARTGLCLGEQRVPVPLSSLCRLYYAARPQARLPTSTLRDVVCNLGVVPGGGGGGGGGGGVGV